MYVTTKSDATLKTITIKPKNENTNNYMLKVYAKYCML